VGGSSHFLSRGSLTNKLLLYDQRASNIIYLCISWSTKPNVGKHKKQGKKSTFCTLMHLCAAHGGYHIHAGGPGSLSIEWRPYKTLSWAALSSRLQEGLHLRLYLVGKDLAGTHSLKEEEAKHIPPPYTLCSLNRLMYHLTLKTWAWKGRLLMVVRSFVQLYGCQWLISTWPKSVQI
jgi:hypothetical protein